MLYKKLYKNISVVALGTALFSLPVFTACESDVVDLEPVDKFSELTAYGTEERCELAVVGAYDAAQCGMYVDPNDFGWARGYPFGAASILQGEPLITRCEDMNAIPPVLTCVNLSQLDDPLCPALQRRR